MAVRNVLELSKYCYRAADRSYHVWTAASSESPATGAVSPAWQVSRARMQGTALGGAALFARVVESTGWTHRERDRH